MAASEYVDCELFLSACDQARLLVAGRDYSGRPRLEAELERRLLEVELEPIRYGALLFQALFPAGDELLAGYRESLTVARREGRRLRLRLHLAAATPPELHDLHWELLYDPDRKIALGRSQEIAFSRYLGVSSEPGKAVVGRPKLLVVLSCPRDLPDYDLPDVGRAALRRALEHALLPLTELVSWEFLDGPATVERIRDHLVAGGFHALHLTAHGLLPPEEATARLVLETGDGHADFVDEDLFSEAFAGQRNLRLVNLIACHGGASAGRDPFSGLGPALVRRGVPAVVAMRRQISVGDATRFTEHFYRNLARSGRVDVAANEARQQLYLGEPDSPEWGTPALFMRLAGGRLWRAPDDAVAEPVDAGASGDSAGTPVATAAVETLALSELMDRARLAEELGDERVAEILSRHDCLARDLAREHEGREADRAGGFLMLFKRPIQAVRWALACHRAITELSRDASVELACRVAIHLGEVVVIETPATDVAGGARRFEIEGLARPIAERLMSLAMSGQTLLSAAAFDLARRSAVGAAPDEALHWMAHGDYLLAGVLEPMAVYEVGAEGSAPLQPPPDAGDVRRAAGDRTILGWRPAIGLEVPQRPKWVLEQKLSEGGFGEVWLAGHEKIKRQRVFKFCFEAERLKALQREITLFRLLKEELGDRDDIARILDWNFERAPYFIESEYAADGNLVEWADGQGGIASVPMAQRLEIVAQLATALAAAHSVGVLHKDVKPTNVLIAVGGDGALQVRLADFGIGAVTERERLAAAGITVLGLTARTEEQSSSYGGTRLYMAPEVLEGKRATLQADVYALGVVLYQVVAGDFTRALAPGWRRDVDDELLCEDIALAVDGSPERRLGNALRISERLCSLESRRQEREAERREREQARQVRQALLRSRKRRKLVALLIAVLALFAGAMMIQSRRVAREAETARRALEFMVDMFKVSHPNVALVNSAREALDRGVEKSERELPDKPEIQTRLMHAFGVVYQGLGLYDAAVSQLEGALATRRQLFGAEHREVAESLHALGEIYWYREEFEQAETLTREALTMRRRLLGEEHPDIATSLNNLAWVLQGRDDYQAAEPLFREALAMRRRLLGEHLDVSVSLYGLAALLYTKGDYEGAEPLYREALAMRRRLSGKDDLEVALILNNLALLLHTKGDYDQAESYYRETLSINRRLLGEEHPEVATNLNNLALLFHLQGDLEVAEPLYREALAMRRRLFGEHNLRVASTLSNLGALLHMKMDYEAAELFLREALAMERQLLGDEHAGVAIGLTNLARLLIDRSASEEAENLIRTALKIFHQALPEGHWRTAFAQSVLGGSLNALGDHAEAESLLLESYPVLKQKVGEDAWYTKEVLHRLVTLYESWGKPERAAEFRGLLASTADGIR